jgi:hypothetical protein
VIRRVRLVVERAERGDREGPAARAQANFVHAYGDYDLELLAGRDGAAARRPFTKGRLGRQRQRPPPSSTAMSGLCGANA